MLTETLTLSRYRLADFLACQRRFQLRYQIRLAWPAPPLAERWAALRERGEQFHRLLERHFLGLPIMPEAVEDAELRRWWSLFRNSHFQLPTGTVHPERRLTVPLGGHLLNGRFDLLISQPPAAHIFDWKTGKPKTEADLHHDWQTRLYLGMLAESGGSLGGDLHPDQITITYWYVMEPNAPRTIRYNQAWHDQNWSEIQTIVSQIDARLALDKWPLTADWSQCRQCAYQIYCGREEAGDAIIEESEESQDGAGLFLEPELP